MFFSLFGFRFSLLKSYMLWVLLISSLVDLIPKFCLDYDCITVMQRLGILGEG